MANPVSAVQCISPAFGRTTQILFRPFRFGLWARLAMITLVTGEMGGGGGGSSLGNLGSVVKGRSGKELVAAAQFLRESGWQQIQPYLFWVVLGVLALGALLLLWVYSDCVYRFILLDSVLTGQCRLREGWRQWRGAGRRYLLWVVAFGFSALVVLAIVIGIPMLLAYRAAWFEKADQHVGAFIAGGILVFPVALALVIAMTVIDLFGRDFLVPVMALENVRAADAWRRLVPMMGAEKGAYALYVLMKIVLNFGSGIIFTIVSLIVVLILLIPLGIVSAVVFYIGLGVGLDWNSSTILLVAAFALLAVAAVLYVIGFTYAPGLVFFQSYTLLFFGTRYEPLGRRMFPSPAAAAPPPSAPVAGPWPPPEPSAV